MSLPQFQLQSSHGGLDEDISQANPKGLENDEAEANALLTDTAATEGQVKSLRDVLATLKRPADGKCFRCLCDHGVFRILTWLPTPPDLPTGIGVYDALPLSPFYIKAYLDRHKWYQEKEDTFRGVDGRTVPKEQWLNPPPGILPSLGSEHECEEERRRIHEEKKQLEERITRGEIDEEAGPACGSVQSDYNLDPH